MRVIILEEDPSSRGTLRARLEDEGFHVEDVGSPLEFYRCMAADGYDLALVDADLAEGAGLEILSWLSGKGSIGIVALSAGNEARDRIASFRNGADLHFTKPVDGDELAHGLRSLVRRLVRDERRRGQSFAPAAWWFFDPVHWTLQAPNGKSVKLTAVETKFVQCLLIQSGGLVARAGLRAELGYADDEGGDKNLDAVVRRLRRKIEKATETPAPIQTVHGRGYLFSAQVRLERRRSGER